MHSLPRKAIVSSASSPFSFQVFLFFRFGNVMLPSSLFHPFFLSLPRQPLMPYEFAYEVKDDATTNYQNRVEFVEDGVLRGSYSLLAPDGVVRTSVYSDTGNGFEVSYEAIMGQGESSERCYHDNEMSDKIKVATLN